MTHPTIQQIRVGTRDFLIVEVQNPTGNNILYILQPESNGVNYVIATEQVFHRFTEDGQQFRLEVETLDSSSGATHRVVCRTLDDDRFSATRFNRLGQEPYTFPPVEEWSACKPKACTSCCTD